MLALFKSSRKLCFIEIGYIFKGEKIDRLRLISMWMGICKLFAAVDKHGYKEAHWARYKNIQQNVAVMTFTFDRGRGSFLLCASGFAVHLYGNLWQLWVLKSMFHGSHHWALKWGPWIDLREVARVNEGASSVWKTRGLSAGGEFMSSPWPYWPLSRSSLGRNHQLAGDVGSPQALPNLLPPCRLPFYINLINPSPWCKHD